MNPDLRIDQRPAILERRAVRRERLLFQCGEHDRVERGQRSRSRSPGFTNGRAGTPLIGECPADRWPATRDERRYCSSAATPLLPRHRQKRSVEPWGTGRGRGVDLGCRRGQASFGLTHIGASPNKDATVTEWDEHGEVRRHHTGLELSRGVDRRPARLRAGGAPSIECALSTRAMPHGPRARPAQLLLRPLH